jgi:transposase-like protein
VSLRVIERNKEPGIELDMHQLDCQHQHMAKKKVPSTASSSPAPKKAGSKKGVRYSDSKKAEVVQFVQGHNQANGRGGQAAAVKKYGVSALTISKWSKKDGKGPQKAPAASKKKALPTKSASSANSTGAKLVRMLAIQQELSGLRHEFDSLKQGL